METARVDQRVVLGVAFPLGACLVGAGVASVVDGHWLFSSGPVLFGAAGAIALDTWARPRSDGSGPVTGWEITSLLLRWGAWWEERRAMSSTGTNEAACRDEARPGSFAAGS